MLLMNQVVFLIFLMLPYHLVELYIYNFEFLVKLLLQAINNSVYRLIKRYEELFENNKNVIRVDTSKCSVIESVQYIINLIKLNR